ncbi:alcohol dehydrogenase catalytic domain-containing protein [Eupransor demetentiae]|uniref:NADPH:quinone reductase or related Zn-dependent oxidoreductase (Qor) n=1 Tax=Eupransor demetentiae TaxID=3109584 RepID=A0ABP0EQ65_9LACO|nr:NADPH:quinone reductase or related Zn-dependent oxidoreductase (Qor) [Lactobacillaceae bacterium LMG 33000]
MQAYLVKKAGGPEVLERVTRPKPGVKPGWSRIKIKGFGLNHSEVFTREGKSPSVHFPRILGIEAVGVIDGSSDEEKLPLGRAVVTFMGEMDRAYDGSYSEYVLVPNKQIYPVKTNFSWTDLAAIPETFYTAYGIFKSLQFKADDQLLIRAASSSVGFALLKLVKALPFSVQVTGTTRSAAKAKALQAAGFDQVIVTDNPNQLESKLNFDKMADLIGPTSLLDSFAHLKEYGIVSSTGQLGGQWTLPNFDPISDIPNNRYLTGFYSGDVEPGVLQAMFNYLEDQYVDVRPNKVFPFLDLVAAHHYLDRAEGMGKVVVML